MAPRTRFLALIGPLLIASLLFAACSDDEQAPDTPTATPELVATGGGAVPPGTIFASSDPPGTTATAEGQTVEMGIGTYCWTTMCSDAVGPVTKATLQVSKGATILVARPAGAPPLREVHASVVPAQNPTNLSSGSQVWADRPGPETNLGTAVDASGIEVEVALDPGRYVLTVGMYFERGDIFYGVVLDVR